MKGVRRKHTKIAKVFYLFNHHSITPSLHHSPLPIPQGFSIKITIPSLFCLQPFAFLLPSVVISFQLLGRQTTEKINTPRVRFRR